MSGPVLVLGAAGMLGHKVFRRLDPSGEVIGTVRQRWGDLPESTRHLLPRGRVLEGVDAADWEALSGRLRALRPAAVVNCVGIIKQRSEAKSAVPSLIINALLPHRLAEATAEWGGRLIHFSTDCVFSGRHGGYREEDQSDAEDLYGRSKFLGEVATGNATTLRTSIIGRELSGHRSLLDWFLSQRGPAVRGFSRAIYSGITTNEMADVVHMIIADWPNLHGLFQVVAKPISKYDLLTLLRDAYQLDLAIEPDEREVCDRSMHGERFAAATGWRAPSWPELCRRLATDGTPYAMPAGRRLAAQRMELRNV